MKKINPQAYEKYVVFNGEGEVPEEELLGRCSDYARLALGYYLRKRFVRAIFWAIMCAASSSFETAYLYSRGQKFMTGEGTRAKQVDDQRGES